MSADEFKLISKLRLICADTLRGGISGIGDDCSSLDLSSLESSLSGFFTFSTDSLLEGRHFDLNYTSAYELGIKSIAVNLSDIAASGSTPVCCLISLQRPAYIKDTFIEELYSGMANISKRFGCSIVGGDTVLSEKLAISVSITGFTKKSAIRRNGAVLGDELWLTGAIGGAGAGLKMLETNLEIEQKIKKIWLERYNLPTPRNKISEFLAKEGIPSSMIDVSDGLIQDAAHLAEESKVIIRINSSLIPLEIGLLQYKIGVEEAIGYGDDYELLFTAPNRMSDKIQAISREFSLPITKIGEVKSANNPCVEVEILKNNISEIVDGKQFPGFKHF